MSTELAERVAHLEQQVAALLQPTPPSPGRRLDHDATDRQLVAALSIEGMVGLSFTAADVIVHAAKVPGAYLLRATLRELSADTPQRLGKVLQRLLGRSIDGRAVARVGRHATGIIWTLTVEK